MPTLRVRDADPASGGILPMTAPPLASPVPPDMARPILTVTRPRCPRCGSADPATQAVCDCGKTCQSIDHEGNWHCDTCDPGRRRRTSLLLVMRSKILRLPPPAGLWVLRRIPLPLAVAKGPRNEILIPAFCARNNAPGRGRLRPQAMAASSWSHFGPARHRAFRGCSWRLAKNVNFWPIYFFQNQGAGSEIA